MARDPLLSPESLSERLGGIPIDTIYRWNHQGTGPKALKVGKHLRYRPEDVEAWLDGREAGPGAAT